MNTKKRMKWVIILSSSILLFSCSNNEESNQVQQTTVSTNKMTSKNIKNRTEDMLIFRTKLNEITEMQQQKVDRTQIQVTFLLAAKDFLKANNEKIDSSETETQIISRAFALYSKKTKSLNPTKK